MLLRRLWLPPFPARPTRPPQLQALRPLLRRNTPMSWQPRRHLALPASSDAVMQSVAAATAQSVATVQHAADAVSAQVTQAVRHAKRIVDPLVTVAPHR